MTDKAVDAGEYYQAHAADEREFYRVYVARPVKEGERITVTTPLPMVTRAEEDGYEISGYTGMHSSDKAFMSAADFAEKTLPADIYAPAAAVEDLPADIKVKPVAKGKAMVSNNAGINVQGAAPYDGVIVEAGKNRLYFSNYELTSLFNYAGRKESTHEEILVRMKDEPPVKGIILGEEVTFAFKGGDYEAKMGSALFPNPKDEDGYSANGSEGFASVGLRLTALANPGTTLEENLKVSKPLTLKHKA